MKKFLKMNPRFCIPLFSLFMFGWKSKELSLSLSYLSCLSMVLGFDGNTSIFLPIFFDNSLNLLYPSRDVPCATIWHSDGILKITIFVGLWLVRKS
jgi:hypothetical protein